MVSLTPLIILKKQELGNKNKFEKLQTYLHDQQYYTCFYSLEKNDNVIIELEDGKILGASSYTVSGRKYSNFKGIPYAKPPVCMRHEIK